MRFTIDYGKGDEDVTNTLVVLSSDGSRAPAGGVVVRLLGFFVCIFGIAMVLCAYLFDTKLLAVVGLVVAAVGIILSQQFAKLYLERERTQRLAGIDTTLYTGKRTFEVDGVGIRIQTGRRPRSFAWGALAAWGCYSHYVYARAAEGALVLVDANQIGDEQRAELEALLAEHVGPQEVRKR